MSPLHRVAHALLVVVLVSTGGSAPFAHVHAPAADHKSADHSAPGVHGASVHGHEAHQHHQGQDAHWHLPVRHAAVAGDAAPRVGATPHDHAAIPFPTVAEERPSTRAGATPALVVVWQADVAPPPIERPISVAATARSNPPPRLALGARAPPV